MTFPLFKNYCFGLIFLLNLLVFKNNSNAQEKDAPLLQNKINQLSKKIEQKVISWRRDFHLHPELSNREFRTAKIVAEHLKKLGMDVQTGIAHTGVVAILWGKNETPVVALRADMDALPETEALDLPFASKIKTTYDGKEVGAMHACGHDAHTAMLMGAAEVLSTMREKLPGSVKFIFQPAEEGAPAGEQGGAELMIKQGVLENPKPDAIFGLHVFPFHVGKIQYRSGPIMAAVDGLRIVVRGKQTHGAIPWGGVDPIVAASQIVLGLQTIVSRQIDITEAPAIISIGSIHGGLRSNIVPNQVELVGTIRTIDPTVQKNIHERIKTTATSIALGAGATAEVTISSGYPVTINDPQLTEKMVPVLERLVGKNNVTSISPKTVAEDFSFYQQKIPGMFFFLGIAPKETDLTKVAQNHSPYFFVDESALIIGVRAMTNLVVNFLEQENEF